MRVSKPRVHDISKVLKVIEEPPILVLDQRFKVFRLQCSDHQRSSTLALANLFL